MWDRGENLSCILISELLDRSTSVTYDLVGILKRVKLQKLLQKVQEDGETV